MFDEDIDIDFDEILNCSPPVNSTFKRHSTEPLQLECNKKARTSDFECSVQRNNSSTSSLIEQVDIRSTNSSRLESAESNSDAKKPTFLFQKIILKPEVIGSSSKKSSVLFENSAIDMAKNGKAIIRTSSAIETENKWNRNKYFKFSSENQSDSSVIKRKFPGPAGLLPVRGSEGSKINIFEQSVNLETKEEVCSQNSCLVFSQGPWDRMKTDFLHVCPETMFLPDKYNIKWIKSKAMMKNLINQKAPFLAAFVHSICSHSIQNPIVNIVLKDNSGTIHGTILHNLYEEYSNDLTVGSVIILKEVGVLNTGSNNEPYLTITPNNLVSIYIDQKKIDTKSDNVFKITIQNVSPKEILDKIIQVKRLQEKDVSTNKPNIRITALGREIIEPENICETFKKAVHHSKLDQKSSLRPNLSNLRPKTVVLHNTNKTNFNNNINNEVMDFFEDGGMEDFFNEEHNFCSTQLSQKIHRNEEIQSTSTKSETNVERIPTQSGINVAAANNFHITVGTIKENCQLWENAFDGVDANSLFDDF